MFSNSIEYSLDTPKNILEQNIFSMLKKDKNMLSGGGLEMGNCVIIIIGIIIVIIGFMICWFKNNLVETQALIQNIVCDDSSNPDRCKISITYIVNSIVYSKIIQMNKSNLSNEISMTIYYSESDPNIIELYNFNYSIIGICLIIFGAFLFMSSIGCSSYFGISNTNVQLDSDTNSDIYSNVKNEKGVSIVYS
jgi:hypothetical protein